MRIVCLSDTHNCHAEVAVPAGDLLIHAGDATVNGTPEEIAAFAAWFSSLPHKSKVFVAGNHDWLFETEPAAARALLGDRVTYLMDSSAEIAGLKIYGSPWQPRFYDWAFNLERGPQMAEKWEIIPDDIDILVTHGPPNGILDAVERTWGIDHTGCEELRKRVDAMAGFGRLRLHIFGHIHSGYGTATSDGVTFINATICDEQYRPTRDAIVYDL